MVAIVTAVGALWYGFVEGFDPVDALYQSVITVSTVGFGEVQPLDQSGRMFTIVLIIFGVGAIGFALAGLVELLLESALERIMSRREGRTLDRLSDHLLICGFGRTGQSVADMVPDAEHVGVIELDAERCSAADRSGFVFLEGDCTADEVLERAGVSRARAIIICLTSDSDAISTVLSARAANPDLRIIVRAHDVQTLSKLELAGADRVVSSTDMAARRLVADTFHPELTWFLDNALHNATSELTMRAIRVPANRPNSDLRIADLEQTGGVRVIGVQQPSGELTAIDKAAPLPDGLLFVAGTAAELTALATRIEQ